MLTTATEPSDGTDAGSSAQAVAPLRDQSVQPTLSVGEVSVQRVAQPSAGSFTTPDASSGASIRSIAVAANGTLYITDDGEKKVYVVTVGTTTVV